MTERTTIPLTSRFGWERLSYPYSNTIFRPPWHILKPPPFGIGARVLVLLLHSWSLLHWDGNGHARYRDDRRTEEYRKMVRNLSKNYDIVTTSDLLDLLARGTIKTARTVDLALTELRVPDCCGKVLR